MTLTQIQRDDIKVIESDSLKEFGAADWSIIEDRRGDLPEWPEHIFPQNVREYIKRASRGAGVTFAHVAAPFLSIASGIIGTSRRVQASRSFIQPCASWSALVGYSGTGKTPGISATVRALAEIERMQKDRNAELQRQHETKVEAAKVALKQWLNAVDEAVKGGMPAPPKPMEAAAVGPFVRPRLYVSDITIERVAVLIQSRPAGLPVIVDELAGLFANMSRYSGGSDREFWLQAWNADPYTVERMGRDPIVIDRLIVSVTGGFQPDKLASAFEGDNDGMYARLLFAWPSEAGYRPLADDVAEVEPEIVNALKRLMQLGQPDSEGVFAPRSIPLSSDAGNVFEQFRQFLHDGKDGLEGRESEWWSKGAAQVLRIAGTLAMIEWAWSGGPEPTEITSTQIDNAVTLWRDYFWPHSRAAIRYMGATRRQSNERRTLLWLRKQERQEVSIEDLRRGLFHYTLNAAETGALLDRLVTAGWLKKKTSKTSGRPVYRWEVNPLLHMSTSGPQQPDPEGWTFNADDEAKRRLRERGDAW